MQYFKYIDLCRYLQIIDCSISNHWLQYFKCLIAVLSNSLIAVFQIIDTPVSYLIYLIYTTSFRIDLIAVFQIMWLQYFKSLKLQYLQNHWHCSISNHWLQYFKSLIAVFLPPLANAVFGKSIALQYLNSHWLLSIHKSLIAVFQIIGPCSIFNDHWLQYFKSLIALFSERKKYYSLQYFKSFASAVFQIIDCSTLPNQSIDPRSISQTYIDCSISNHWLADHLCKCIGLRQVFTNYWF